MTKRFGNTTVIAILVVLIVAAGGVLVYYGTKPTDQPTNTINIVTNTSALDPADEQQLDSETPTAPTITDSGDLDTATATLDQVDLNAGTEDSEQLDTYADEF